MAKTMLAHAGALTDGLSALRNAPAVRPGACEADTTAAVDFARLVGAAGWNRLPAAVRRRFADHGEATVHYVGVMAQVDCTAAGWLFAQLCRLVGTPLAPHRGRAVPVRISVTTRPDGGIEWRREYRFPHRRAVSITTVKRMGPDDTLYECLGFGLYMHMDVFEWRHELHFLSRGYEWRLGRWRLRLPALFPPGITHIVHADQGDGFFRFIMSIGHPWFGRMFHQDGLFTREVRP